MRDVLPRGQRLGLLLRPLTATPTAGRSRAGGPPAPPLHVVGVQKETECHEVSSQHAAQSQGAEGPLFGPLHPKRANGPAAGPAGPTGDGRPLETRHACRPPVRLPTNTRLPSGQSRGNETRKDTPPPGKHALSAAAVLSAGPVTPQCSGGRQTVTAARRCDPAQLRYPARVPAAAAGTATGPSFVRRVKQRTGTPGLWGGSCR